MSKTSMLGECGGPAVTNGGEILVAGIANSSNPASKCSVRINPADPAEALISFEFLDPNDGCTIGILHTDPKAAPVLRGSVMGYKFKVVEAAPRKPLKGHMRWAKPFVFCWVPLVLGVAAIIGGFLSNEQISSIRTFFNSDPNSCPQSNAKVSGRIFLISVGITYVLAAFYYYWQNRSLYPNNLKIEKKTAVD